MYIYIHMCVYIYIYKTTYVCVPIYTESLIIDLFQVGTIRR